MPKIANRLNKIPPYLFANLDIEKQKALQNGMDILDFGVGDPDLATPSEIIKEMKKAISDKTNHNYPPYNGIKEFREAVKDYYKDRFEVQLEPDSEIIALIGSKEGIANICFTYLDEGDYSLVPDPGYPVYSNATILAGGVPYTMPLLEENNFLPDLTKIPNDIAQKAKLMFLNYPNNPTSATANIEFFKEVVEFAKKYDILVCHDAAYLEIGFDSYKPISFLTVPEAKSIGVEFNSLSKPFNMTGWRLGMVVGNETAVKALCRFKTNIDSGVFKAIQKAGIKAFNILDKHLPELNNIYKDRREMIVKTLKDLGFNVYTSNATFYVWVKIPSNYSSIDFVSLLLQKTGILASPGIGFGEYGEGYIRLSLTADQKCFTEFETRLKEKWDKNTLSFKN